MATKEMARRFIQEADVYKQYSSIVEYVLSVFIARAEKEGNTRFATDLRDAQATYHPDFKKAMEITEQVYAETFTDEELNDLIVLNNNPAIRKSRALGADLVNEIFEKVLAVSP
jgi:uncharacterized membrane protein